MPGRPLLDEEAYRGGRYDDPVLARRRAVMRETVAALAGGGRARLRALAGENLARWAETPSRGPWLEVVPDDWGVATARVTRRAGRCFAVLNMANAFVPGGAYVEGTAAQEENMFRRTDCHEAVADEQMDPGTHRYTPAMTALLGAADGVVYLDTATPRVCFRGPEDQGYPRLADQDVFPFFELRAAAMDLRGGLPFDRDETRRRIRAQLATLERAGVRHAVLSAFGCGAFHNPAPEVAALYREALRERAGDFDEIVFAVFAPGYGPDNFTPFAEVLGAGFA